VEQDGGSSVLAYAIEWDKNGDFELIQEANSLEFIHIDGVESGVYYQLRYRARNIHGLSEASDSFSILAATIPNTPYDVSI
jgi:hypothetical protein